MRLKDYEKGLKPMPLEYLYPIEVQCPYCLTKNKILPTRIDNPYMPIAIVCDVEEGGCDKYFGVKLYLHVTSEVFIMERKNENG